MSYFTPRMDWKPVTAKASNVKRYKRDEKSIQDQVARRLRDAGYLVIQINSGMQMTEAGAPFRSYFIWNNKKSSGVADLLAVKNGQTWFLEIKKPGGRQSETQKQFEELCGLTGNVYKIIKDVSEIEDML